MIRDNIKRLCKEQGRTVGSLEEEAEISKGYIHTMTNPSIGLLNKIADKLGVDVCELINEGNENGQHSLHSE